ncbi:Ppx/GppA family phosphatase [Halobacillus kuroshimensis]|uniref:Ppx/GppA family phosphatase n=1 Tax=Halobacillus kuroshimensis TaxID=302481 RepID=A0ABS3E100_9BACI|nr:Ppx/GppA family phosphatase [Halobacillus kuroshimensis]MBN8237269.1 Ppx/GppA family phosphatase [Halobacillus kuroshimensis]
MARKFYAIIDVGSNTMRLVIYLRDKGGRLREVENVKAVARLRNHLTKDGLLSTEGLQTLLTTLKSFKEVAESYTLEEMVCVATATIRQAGNQEEIITQVSKHTGFDMRILSDHEEAYYGYLAVVNSTPVTEGITVDIGGGSTEVTYFKDRELIESYSFPFGALTLKQDFFKNELPTENEFAALRRYLLDQFKSLPWLQKKDIPLIGIGGGARNLVQIDQNLKEYPLAGLHQYKMKDSDLAFIKNYLFTLPMKKLQKVEGLSKDRADIILPATEVFHSLYDTMQASGFILSRKGLRDGVFFEQLTKDMGTSVFPNVLEESIQELINDYDLNVKQIQHVQHLAHQLFSQLHEKGLGSLKNSDWQEVKRASYVFNLGDYIDSEASAQHTFYLLANRTIDGLMHMERLRMALMASYKNKTIFKQFLQPYKKWFLKDEQKKLRLLGSLLKFCYSLDSTRRQTIQSLELTKEGHDLHITCHCSGEWMPEEYQAEKQKKHLEKSLKKTIELSFVENKK